MAAREQIVVEALQRFLQHVVRHGEAFVARILEELDDVRRQDLVDVAVAAPHREMARRNLHRRDAADRAFDARLALIGRQAVDVQVLGGLLVQQQRAEALAGGLLDAAVRILQEILQRGRERQRRQARHGEPRGDRIGEQAVDRVGAERDRLELVERARRRAHHGSATRRARRARNGGRS